MSRPSCEKNLSTPSVESKTDKIPRNLWYRESLIFLGTFIFFYNFARMGIDPHHDGVMLIPAIRVAEGAVVFRDVFCQYGLLVPLLQGAAAFLFGKELLVIRILTVLFYCGSAVLLDLLWRRFLPKTLSWLTPVIFLLLAACTIVTFHSWNSVYALFFMLLSGFFLLRHLEEHHWGKWNLFAAGISAGLTWGCRTPCGIVTVFAAISVLFGLNWFTGKSRKTIAAETGFYAAGCLTTAVLALAYIGLNGAWDDFIKQNFGYVIDFVQQRGRGDERGTWQYFCDSMLPFFQKEYLYCHTFFALLPLGALVLLYMNCRKGFIKGKDEMKKVLPLAALLILGLGSWHQYYPVPCVRHLFWGGAPLFGAYLLIIYNLWKTEKAFYGKLTAVVMIFFLVLAIFPRVCGAGVRLSGTTRRKVDAAGIHGIGLSKTEWQLVHELKKTETLPESLKSRGVINWTEDSLLTTFLRESGFQNLQFYRYETTQYPGYDEKILQHIMEKRPIVLVDHPVQLPGYTTMNSVTYMGKTYRILLPME